MRMDLSFSDLGIGVGEEDDTLPEAQGYEIDCYNNELHYYGPYPPGAVDSLTRLLAPNFFPDHDALLIRRARLYFALLDYPKAKEDLDCILQKNSRPRHRAALFLRSMVLYDLDSHAEALADLSLCLPDTLSDFLLVERCYYSARIYLKNDLLENALVYVEKLLVDNRALLNTHESGVDVTDVLDLRYQIYVKQERFSEALLDLTALLEQTKLSHPKHYDFLLARAEIYIGQKKADAARIDLDEYLNQFPKHRKALTYRHDLCKAEHTQEEVLRQGVNKNNYVAFQQALANAKKNERQMALDKHALFCLDKLSPETLPSLKTLSIMSIFENEPDLYATGAVLNVRDKPELQSVLHDSGINSITLAAMHQRLRPNQACADTVFDQMARKEEDSHVDKRPKY
ncbi:MAG: hypothetical protein QNK11_06680 [Legionella sp.]|nr:hypothetical protein [Legionella sp.]